MELSDLQVFQQVAQCGGITRAAEKLNRVPSNVTARIQKLEEELQQLLFIREKNRLYISSAGHQLLDYANQILSLADQAKHSLQGDKPNGTLRIGYMDAVAATRVVRPLKQFHEQFPEVSLNVRSAPTGLLIEHVLEGKLDLALVADPEQDTRLGITHIFDEELVVVSSRRHQTISSPNDLSANPTVLGFNYKCAYRNRLTNWLKHGQCVPKVIEINSYHTMLSCVAAGMGIAMVPRALLNDYPFTDSIQCHTLASEWAVSRTALIWRKGFENPSMDAFSKQLTA
ncbi:LysR family transcriptional regulator [Oceaniserpentilla sp. 4NH20-0058]|uniref:LysR substrate-binding domain-containing protein n=1 Tax=Oceaniserpentilla sp. 4NH20-0058 TaxID=3127660 RepID=UPI00310280D7